MHQKSKIILGIVLVCLIILAGSISGNISAQTSLSLNEIVVSTSGTDWEFVEIAGSGGADLSNLTFLEVDRFGVVDDLIDLSGQTVPSSGFFVAASPAAETQYGITADLGFPDNFLTNNTSSYFLVENFTGNDGDDLDTNDDGNLDNTPWTNVIGELSLIENAGENTYATPALGPDGSFLPAGAFNCDSGWQLHEFSTVDVDATPGDANECDVTGSGQVFINEVRINKSGSETDFFEIQGEPNSSLDGLSYVVLSGEFEPGQVDYAISLDGSSIPSDGFFVAGGSNTASTYGITPDLAVEFDFFGTPTTHLLVNGFTGSSGDDYDTDNDGILDSPPWTEIVDSVSFVDGDSDTDYSYSSSVVGPDGSFTPAGTYRCIDAPFGSFDNNQLSFFSANGTPGLTNATICDPIKINEIQGSGLDSPFEGATVRIEGVIVGDYQDGASGVNGDLNGFFIQEEDADADSDPLTSEGIFVFDGSSPATDVEIGDLVEVIGDVSEFNGLTEITSFSGVTIVDKNYTLPTETSITLPVSNIDDFEAYEGMRVIFPQALNISEYFNFDRFGEVVLTYERPFQPTSVFDPGSTDAEDLADYNARNRITLDDGRTNQNPDPALHPAGGEFNLSNRFRGGDQLQDLEGVLSYSFGLYRVQPTEGASFISQNPRPLTHDEVGGNIEVAAFNVLNYFTTLDTGPDICGPSANLDCRGANNVTEFQRQRNKIIAAILDADADIIGLNEIENHPNDEAVKDLVAGLNDDAGPGTYAYIPSGPIGTDAIKVALLYKPDSVTPVGSYAILDSSVDSRFIDTKNRPVLAQSFESDSNHAVVTVAVNHLKSKGSSCDDVGDPDVGNGADSCNLTRLKAAQALVDWLETDPTNVGDPDFLIIGDLNSYDKEDPIDAILLGSDDLPGTGDEYTDLNAAFIGEFAYSYVFDGQYGYLDYAMSNTALTPQVTGTTIWHINADEPDILDYDTSFKQDAQDALYEPNAFRSSDHDPVIVGLDLQACKTATPSIDSLWPDNHEFVEVSISGVTDTDDNSLPIIEILSIFQDEEVLGRGSGKTSPDGQGVGTSIAEVRAERSGNGNGRVYHIYFTASDGNSNSCYGKVLVSVPFSQGNNGAAVDDGPLYDSTVSP